VRFPPSVTSTAARKTGAAEDYLQSIFLIERICGICSFLHSMAYCQGIEEMMNVQVPPRANSLRIIWAEMHRVHSHLLWAGLLADSFGFESLFMEICVVAKQCSTSWKRPPVAA